MGDSGPCSATIAIRPVKAVFPVHNDDTGPVVEVDHLVIGAGPAGASMGCFLGQHGTLPPHHARSQYELEGTDCLKG